MPSVRIVYATAEYVVVGIFRDRVLQSLEYFTDVPRTLDHVKSLRDMPTVYVVAAADGFDEIKRAGEKIDDTKAVLACGETMLVSEISAERLGAYPPDCPVLSEISCVYQAIREGYLDDLSIHTQSAVLLHSGRRNTLLVLEHETPTHVHFDAPVTDDGHVAVINELMADPTGSWRGHTDRCYVVGASRAVSATRLLRDTLFPEVLRDCEITDVKLDRLVTHTLTDQTTVARFTADPTHPLYQSAIPVVLAGAALSYERRHGADFRRILPSTPPVRDSLLDRLRAKLILPNPGTSRLAASDGLGAVVAVVCLLTFAGWTYYTLSQRAKAADATLVREKQRAEANRTIENEVNAYQNLIRELNDRIKAINRMREAQRAAYDITNNVQWNTPDGLRFSRLTIKGRDIKIEGYVTVSSAAAAQGQPALGASTDQAGNITGVGISKAIDVADLVGKFQQALQDAGKYTNIQSNYVRAVAEKSTFTITCTYQGEIYTEQIQLKPLTPLVESVTTAQK